MKHKVNPSFDCDEIGFARILSSDDVEDREEKMTVCIAGLADDGRVAVVCCDREFQDESVDLRVEGYIPKAAIMGGKTLVCMAGPSVRRPDLFNGTISLLKDDHGIEFSGVVDQLLEDFRRVRNDYANAMIFRPRGMDLKSFYASCSQNWGEFQRELDRRNQTCELKEVLLVCGPEKENIRISMIVNPGQILSLTVVGYAACGSGEPIAKAWLTAVGYTPTLPISQAAYFVFEAKKVSENALGVGKGTDMFIVRKDGAIQVGANVVATLEAIYNRRIQGLERNLEADLAKMQF